MGTQVYQITGIAFQDVDSFTVSCTHANFYDTVKNIGLLQCIEKCITIADPCMTFYHYMTLYNIDDSVTSKELVYRCQDQLTDFDLEIIIRYNDGG
jgi:hypothetical protein